MTYNNIATVNVALQNASLTSRGFGTPLFISTHNYFPERVRTYSSLQEAAEDIPTESNVYKALQSGFSASPRPSFIKVGRRAGDLQLEVLEGSTSASITVSVLDGNSLYTIAASGTGGEEDAVAASLVASIESNADIDSNTNITVVGNVISIEGVGDAKVSIKSLSANIVDSYTATETASQVLSAIEAEDDDFYFITADDHTETFVLAMADVVEAKEKMYFFTTYEAGSLTAYVDGTATDILGKVRNSKYNRTKGGFHQDADKDFPELYYVGYNSPFDAGSVTWNNLVVSLAASSNPLTGLNLSTTERGNLEDRNAFYVENRGSSILRNGQVASGEYIDVIRGRDNLSYDLVEAYTRLFVTQTGSKVPYNDQGIASLEAVALEVLTKYVNRLFINPNFRTNFPRLSEISQSDRSNRVYTQGSWQAELTGAIEGIRPLQGILSIELG